MSFTAWDILNEFAEASRYGRTNHTDRAARNANQRWWNEIGFQTLRPKYVIVPLPVERETCKKCGRIVESRIGCRFKFHLGPQGAGCLGFAT